MEALEAAMKKHHINLDSSSESTSHGHALCAFSYSYISSSYSSSNEWLIDSREYYHKAKDQSIFSTMYECNTQKIFVADDRTIRVVGSIKIHLNDGYFKYVLCFKTFLQYFISLSYHSLR